MADKPPYTLAQLKQETAAASKPLYTPAELKQADERIGIIQLISGATAKGEDFYAYVSLRPSVYEQFIRKMADGETMDVEAFGKVLKKGFGQQPSEDIKKYMEEEFGIDHNFMQHFAEELRKRKNEGKT